MLDLQIYDRRILAIDLRGRRFGYVVFEGHKRLLDYGTGSYPVAGNDELVATGKALAEVLRLYPPSAIVVKAERWDATDATPGARSVMDGMINEARSRSIPICLVNRDDIRHTFYVLGCETKYEIASALTRIFPELVWKLPPKREIWKSEHPRMPMFDAIALGLAYWQHPNTEVSLPPYDPEAD
jgi:hypothetical protein